jgi:Cytochrome c554 and c-prime
MMCSMRWRWWAACVLLIAGCAGGALSARTESVETFVARHWRMPLAPQGPPPARYTPLEASLSPEACGTCHPAQLADWRTSTHAAAMGPGVAGQLVETLAREPATALACQHCHAPLAEQAPLVAETLAPNPAFDAALRARGIPCAACHVRGHARFGPPRRDGSLASTAPRETLPHGGVTRTPAYLASEFCRGCHQFEPDGFALNGTLLENTYAEWKASRFAAAGVQCQNCHMPDRRHLWRGIHDPDMVRSGLTITLVEDEHPADAVSSRLVVENSGVGHRFPTYVTPLVILRAELLDARARPLPGSRVERRIGREVTLDLEREVSDTRLAPGERTELAYARVLDGDAVAARFSVLVYPDAFYTAFFESLLRQGAGRGEDDIRRALDDSRRSAFVVFEKVISRRGRLSPRP